MIKCQCQIKNSVCAFALVLFSGSAVYIQLNDVLCDTEDIS